MSILVTGLGTRATVFLYPFRAYFLLIFWAAITPELCDRPSVLKKKKEGMSKLENKLILSNTNKILWIRL